MHNYGRGMGKHTPLIVNSKFYAFTEAPRARAMLFYERGVIGSKQLEFFFGIENNLTAHSIIATIIANHSPHVNEELPCLHNYKEEE